MEDDRDTREMYALCLTASGFRVEQATTARDALAKAAESTPDAVVTDLSLPGMDGWTLATRLREQPRLGAVPIVAVTGHSVGDDDRFDDMQFAAVLVKPCLPDDLVRAVKRAISSAVSRDKKP